MENVGIVPGPTNPELLFISTDHRAYHVFHNLKDDRPLNVRRADKNLLFWVRDNPIDDRVMYHIRRAGLAEVFVCGYKNVDHGLITSLVERWRPETHTFHLPFGEVSVTLEDVQVIWGLRTDGNPVTGNEPGYTYARVIEKYYTLLGFAPLERKFKGSQISARYMMDMLMEPLPQDPTDEQLEQKARHYILMLLNGCLFPDSTDSLVQMYFLVLIEDLDACGRLGLGGAVLASLYRNLCKTTMHNVLEIGGPLMLLQIWAWSRFKMFSPLLKQITPDLVIGKPFGCRFNQPLRFAGSVKTVLFQFRSMLSALDDSEFVWTPYQQDLHLLAPSCRTDTGCWLSQTYVIFWEIAEQYLPSRVMRQFGFVQFIPQPPLSNKYEHEDLHIKSRRGVTAKRSWKRELRNQIQHCNNRYQYLIQGQYSNFPQTEPGYMAWYWPRTVLHITNPTPGAQYYSRSYNQGGNLNVAVDGLSHVQQQVQRMMQEQDDPALHQFGQQILQTSADYLHYAHGDDRPTYFSPHVAPVTQLSFGTQLTQEQRQHRPRWMRPRGARQDPEAGSSHQHNAGGSGSSHQYQNENMGTSNQYNAGGSGSSPQPQTTYMDTSNQYNTGGVGPSDQEAYRVNMDFLQGGSSMQYEMNTSGDLFSQNILNMTHIQSPMRDDWVIPAQYDNFGQHFSADSIFGNTNPYYQLGDSSQPPNRAVSPVPVNFDFDLNNPGESEEDGDGGRRRRIRRPPPCGTGGTLGHRH